MTNTDTLPHGVAIVVDRSFGPQLPALAARIHVWLLDTPANKEAAEKVWQALTTGHSLEEGVTTFRAASDTMPDQIVASMLSTIDLHHGEYSHTPPWSFVEVYGTAITPALEAALASYGFCNVASLSDESFKAWRSDSEGR